MQASVDLICTLHVHCVSESLYDINISNYSMKTSLISPLKPIFEEYIVVGFDWCHQLFPSYYWSLLGHTESCIAKAVDSLIVATSDQPYGLNNR